MSRNLRLKLFIYHSCFELKVVINFYKCQDLFIFADIYAIDMKKFIPIFFILCLVMPSIAIAKDGGKKERKKKIETEVYVWGASLSFSDSVVYFTEIQHIDGAIIEDKFLPNRHLYSYELKDYMSYEEGKPGRTSFIFFSNKRSKLEKKEQKVKKKLIEHEGKVVRYLGDKFKFTKH